MKRIVSKVLVVMMLMPNAYADFSITEMVDAKVEQNMSAPAPVPPVAVSGGLKIICKIAQKLVKQLDRGSDDVVKRVIKKFLEAPDQKTINSLDDLLKQSDPENFIEKYIRFTIPKGTEKLSKEKIRELLEEAVGYAIYKHVLATKGKVPKRFSFKKRGERALEILKAMGMQQQYPTFNGAKSIIYLSRGNIEHTRAIWVLKNNMVDSLEELEILVRKSLIKDMEGKKRIKTSKTFSNSEKTKKIEEKSKEIINPVKKTTETRHQAPPKGLRIGHSVGGSGNVVEKTIYGSPAENIVVKIDENVQPKISLVGYYRKKLADKFNKLRKNFFIKNDIENTGDVLPLSIFPMRKTWMNFLTGGNAKRTIVPEGAGGGLVDGEKLMVFAEKSEIEDIFEKTINEFEGFKESFGTMLVYKKLYPSEPARLSHIKRNGAVYYDEYLEYKRKADELRRLLLSTKNDPDFNFMLGNQRYKEMQDYLEEVWDFLAPHVQDIKRLAIQEEINEKSAKWHRKPFNNNTFNIDEIANEEPVNITDLSEKVMLIINDNKDLKRVYEASGELNTLKDSYIFTSPKEAISFVKSYKIKVDYAVIDIHMDEMSGSELVKQIKEVDPSIVAFAHTGDIIPSTNLYNEGFDGLSSQISLIVEKGISIYEHGVKGFSKKTKKTQKINKPVETKKIVEEISKDEISENLPSSTYANKVNKFFNSIFRKTKKTQSDNTNSSSDILPSSIIPFMSKKTMNWLTGGTTGAIKKPKIKKVKKESKPLFSFIDAHTRKLQAQAKQLEQSMDEIHMLSNSKNTADVDAIKIETATLVKQIEAEFDKYMKSEFADLDRELANKIQKAYATEKKFWQELIEDAYGELNRDLRDLDIKSVVAYEKLIERLKQLEPAIFAASVYKKLYPSELGAGDIKINGKVFPLLRYRQELDDAYGILLTLKKENPNTKIAESLEKAFNKAMESLDAPHNSVRKSWEKASGLRPWGTVNDEEFYKSLATKKKYLESFLSKTEKLNHGDFLGNELNVVVIYDNDYTIKILEKNYKKIKGFFSVEEALSYIRKNPDKVDCVFVDYTFADSKIQGEDVAKMIADIDPSITSFLQTQMVKVSEYDLFALGFSGDFDFKLMYQFDVGSAVKKARNHLNKINKKLKNTITGEQKLYDHKEMVKALKGQKRSLENFIAKKENLDPNESIFENNNIVIIDDSKVVTKYYNKMHPGVKVFSGVGKALEYISKNKKNIDYVVADYVFGNSTIQGSDLGRKIREIDPSIVSFLHTGYDLSTTQSFKMGYSGISLKSTNDFVANATNHDFIYKIKLHLKHINETLEELPKKTVKLEAESSTDANTNIRVISSLKDLEKAVLELFIERKEFLNPDEVIYKNNNVVLINDNHGVNSSLDEMYENTKTFLNSKDALQYIKDNPKEIDYVLVDYTLEGSTIQGPDIAREIKKINPNIISFLQTKAHGNVQPERLGFHSGYRTPDLFGFKNADAIGKVKTYLANFDEPLEESTQASSTSGTLPSSIFPFPKKWMNFLTGGSTKRTIVPEGAGGGLNKNGQLKNFVINKRKLNPKESIFEKNNVVVVSENITMLNYLRKQHPNIRIFSNSMDVLRHISQGSKVDYILTEYQLRESMVQGTDFINELKNLDPNVIVLLDDTGMDIKSKEALFELGYSGTFERSKFFSDGFNNEFAIGKVQQHLDYIEKPLENTSGALPSSIFPFSKKTMNWLTGGTTTATKKIEVPKKAIDIPLTATGEIDKQALRKLTPSEFFSIPRYKNLKFLKEKNIEITPRDGLVITYLDYVMKKFNFTPDPNYIYREIGSGGGETEFVWKKTPKINGSAPVVQKFFRDEKHFGSAQEQKEAFGILEQIVSKYSTELPDIKFSKVLNIEGKIMDAEYKNIETFSVIKMRDKGIYEDIEFSLFRKNLFEKFREIFDDDKMIFPEGDLNIISGEVTNSFGNRILLMIRNSNIGIDVNTYDAVIIDPR